MQISGRVETFTPAQNELSDIEIRRDFGALLEGAVSAFADDPSYLVDMAEHASLIAYKRELWEVRMEAQRAEKAARAQCSDSTPFICQNKAACGFGECRFAAPAHRDVTTDFRGGDRTRPIDTATGGSYRLEDTIAVLLKERGIAAPAKLSRGSRRKNRD